MLQIIPASHWICDTGDTFNIAYTEPNNTFILIKSTKVLMPRWLQEPRAHAQHGCITILHALPYCMHLLNACK